MHCQQGKYVTSNVNEQGERTRQGFFTVCLAIVGCIPTLLLWCFKFRFVKVFFRLIFFYKVY